MTSRTSATDRALMLLPLDQWISEAAAAEHAEIDYAAVPMIVRTGRRRGVLRTRRAGNAQQIMRIYPGPRRPRRRS
ncbi:hypothetical protein [Streptomyces sp. BH055]|uniref:hypothetical protein n=1 Tax=unclassified Streptomyces TaxID=2593676 RepID=UPI003BB55278